MLVYRILEKSNLTLHSLQFLSSRERNRSHAKRSRERKKALTLELKHSLDSLNRENQLLREQLCATFGERPLETMMEEKKDQSLQGFIEALKDPANRVIDKSMLSFLRSLRENIAPPAPAVD